MKVRIDSESVVVIVLCILAAAAGPAAAQEIDLNEARAIFAEAETVAGGSSELWGVALTGPLLFVEPGSRRVVANVPDGDGLLEDRSGVFVGTLPEGVGMGNTSVEWAGRRWTMLLWPLPEARWERRRLLVHEMYHRIQPELGMELSEAANAHLDSEAGRFWMRLEWRALQAALGTTGEARRRAVGDALAFRARRRKEFPAGIEGERSLELNEGLAEYTGIRVAIPAPARSGWAAHQLDEHDGRAADRSIVRNFAYASGPAYGLLLDAADPDWCQRVDPMADLGELLAAALGVRPEAPDFDARRRGEAYGATRLAAEEAERERSRLALQEAFRARFQEGPTLTLPVGEDFGYSFNPNAVSAFGDVGTVYDTAEVRGAWGRLEVTDGGVLMVRGPGGIEAVVVPAPTDPGARPLQGDGWTLQLAEGWELAEGRRAGDLAIRRR